MVHSRCAETKQVSFCLGKKLREKRPQTHHGCSFHPRGVFPAPHVLLQSELPPERTGSDSSLFWLNASSGHFPRQPWKSCGLKDISTGGTGEEGAFTLPWASFCPPHPPASRAGGMPSAGGRSCRGATGCRDALCTRDTKAEGHNRMEKQQKH